MNRIILKTQALVVGPDTETAAASLAAGAQTMVLSCGPLNSLPEGVTGTPNVELDKIILYPEGRVAGVMGHQVSDNRKVIVNCDAVLLTSGAAGKYEPLCLRFGAVKENGELKKKADGLLINASGQDIGGVFIITDSAVSGNAGGAYAVYVDETIYARFRAHPMVNEEPKIEGEYFLTILGMDGVPKHRLTFENKDGVLSGIHETENDRQPMQDLRMENGYLCWNLWSGTTSSELFTFQVKPYGNMLLGGTWRIDMENAHRTPVMVESSRPHNPFGPPPKD